jgi:hypothetical protein
VTTPERPLSPNPHAATVTAKASQKSRINILAR